MTIGKNNKNFAYAITAGSSGSSTPSSVAITSDELANSASLKTMAGMNYYIPPNGDAIDLNNMTVREHLATIMLNFGCSLPIALLLWLFCGYFRTPAGYKRMLDAASIEKGNIKKIHDEIDTIIKKNGDGSSTNPQNPPIPQNLDTPIPTPLQENPHLNTNLPSSATATNPFSSQSMSPFQNDFSQNPFNQFPIPQDSPSIPRKQYSSNLTDAPEGNRQTGIKIPSRCSLPTNESDTVKISDEAQTLSIADMRQFDCGHINKDLCNPNSYATLIAPITAAGILAIIGSDADKRATMQVPVYKLDEYGVIPIADNKANYSKIHFTCDSKHKQAYASINDTSDTSGSKPLAIGTYIIPCQGGQYKQFQVGDFGKIMSFKQLPSSPPPTQTVPTGMAKVSLKPIFYNGGSLEIDDNANDVKCTVRNNAIYTGKDQTSPVHPGHYLVMEADEKSATNQYITVGSNGQITPANTPARIFNESNFPMKHRRINLARLNLNMLFTPNFSTGWPFPLGYNIDAELENIPKNIFDTSPELKSEHFENVLFNETLSNLDVISLSPDKNTPQHHKINLIRRDNSIVAYNSGSPSQTPALGTYLFPVWLNEKHTHYGFIKFNVGKDGVVVSDIQPAKTTCINNMELRTKASLVQIAQSNAKENKYVTGFQIQSDAMLNSDNVSSMPTHIYLRLDAIGNVYAYHDANNTCPLTQGTVYSIPYWDSTRKKYIHCKIFVAKGGRLEVLRDMSQDMLRNIKQLDGFANGTYALSRIHSTNQGVYYYDENFSFNLEVTGDKLSANSAEFQNGDYVVIGSGRNPIDWVAFKPDAKGVITLTTPNLNPNSNSPKVPVKQNPNSSPQSNLDSNPPIVTLNLPTSSAVTSPPLPNSTACIPLITSSNLPANPDSPKKLLKSELYQAIKANETKPVIAPAHLVGSSSTITTTFTLNVNGNVQASPAVASLDEGTYQINYKEQSYQIQIGRNGFLVETYTLSSDRTYKPLPLPNSNSFYIAELDQNGRYNS
ncbi:MAG: hypothetical protein LBI69_00720, partial [Puniceicoccales bacterium]|nr:hypothetical protein [Puniceicoccales bacterium]